MVLFLWLHGRTGSRAAERGERKSDLRRDVLRLAARKGDEDLTHTPLLQLNVT
jgi:hypothetical protein